MTNLEQNLMNTIRQTLTHDTPDANVYAIFNVSTDDYFSAYSAEIFVKTGSDIQDTQKLIEPAQWQSLLGVLSEPLQAIYDNQQHFDYLIVGHDEHGQFTFKYENNVDMTLFERFVVWEYDEFGIGRRKAPLIKLNFGKRAMPLRTSVLDKYRPVN